MGRLNSAYDNKNLLWFQMEDMSCQFTTENGKLKHLLYPQVNGPEIKKVVANNGLLYILVNGGKINSYELVKG